MSIISSLCIIYAASVFENHVLGQTDSPIVMIEQPPAWTVPYVKLFFLKRDSTDLSTFVLESRHPLEWKFLEG